jgi:hypothetical protein
MDEIIVDYGDDQMIVVIIIGDMTPERAQQQTENDHVMPDITYLVHESGVK